MKFLPFFGQKRKREKQSLDLSDCRSLKRKSNEKKLSKSYFEQLRCDCALHQINTNVQKQNGLLTPSGSPVKQNLFLEDSFSQLNIIQTQRQVTHGEHQIFQLPEIVNRIVKFVKQLDEQEIEEREQSPKILLENKRKPQSYEHALMIYKNEEKATAVWQHILQNKSVASPLRNLKNTLFNCLTINKLWYNVTIEHYTGTLIFKDEFNFQKFIKSLHYPMKPKKIILRKIHSNMNIFNNLRNDYLDLSEVKHLEFFICPNMVPPISWFQNLNSLETLILPGNKLIDDSYLIQILSNRNIKNLKNIDLRACNKITDSGVLSIATHCPQLTSCNLGRHKNGNGITSVSVISLAKYTKIETLGVAGCDITDVGIWELASICGTNIKRLSLNNCSMLTNRGISILSHINFFPNLAVIEIRNLVQVNQIKSLVEFKNWKRFMKLPLLIESCERITKLIMDEEFELKRMNSIIAMYDMTTWVNEIEV